jgi:hypothetical protein
MCSRRDQESFFRPCDTNGSRSWLERNQERQIAGPCCRTFDVFLTIDQNIRHQQNLTSLPFAILFVSVPNNMMESYVPLFDLMREAAQKLQPGEITVIP